MTPAIAPPAFIWSTPDTNRFRGTEADALDLFEAAGFATRWALDHLTPESGAACHWRAIRDGETFDGMTFGRMGLVRRVVAATSSWPAHTLRTALECDDGLGDALIYPLACGNWSFEHVPLYGSGGPPGAGGWAGGESSQEGSESSYGYGWGVGYGAGGLGLVGGVLGGTAVSIPSAATSTENIIPASFESIPSGPVIPESFETAPGGPGNGGPPSGMPPSGPTPVSTPEPGSLGILLAAVICFIAFRWGERMRAVISMAGVPG